jgi:hypothetical protein
MGKAAKGGKKPRHRVRKPKGEGEDEEEVGMESGEDAVQQELAEALQMLSSLNHFTTTGYAALRSLEAPGRNGGS